MLTVLVETTIDLAVEAELYLRLKDSTDINSGDQQAKKMPVYLSIFALAQCVSSRNCARVSSD